MDKLPPAEELARLRQLVKALESGTKIIRGGADVTKQDLVILKREIVYLEKLVEGSGS
jgi:hypothetical protein